MHFNPAFQVWNLYSQSCCIESFFYMQFFGQFDSVAPDGNIALKWQALNTYLN
jgi:hypothetical protein